MSMLMSLSGHYWTIAPFVKHVVRRTKTPPAEPWTATVHHQVRRETRIHGLLQRVEERTTRPHALLVAIHGLGGTNIGHNVIPATTAARDLGLACLRINLRGAGGEGDDFYHGGLWQDIAAALASETLAEYTDIYILGYSMGGHVALCYAAEEVDPRVRAVAAICAPLDLDRSAVGIDRRSAWIYRHHVLAALKRMVVPLVRRRELSLSLAALMRISTLRQWDQQVVAPRFGFESAEDYYAQASAAPRLARLQRPALLVASEADPMVLATAVRPALTNHSPKLDVRWTARGGHVGFPASLDLGERGPLGLEHQALAWLLRQG